MLAKSLLTFPIWVRQPALHAMIMSQRCIIMPHQFMLVQCIVRVFLLWASLAIALLQLDLVACWGSILCTHPAQATIILVYLDKYWSFCLKQNFYALTVKIWNALQVKISLRGNGTDNPDILTLVFVLLVVNLKNSKRSTILPLSFFICKKEETILNGS